MIGNIDIVNHIYALTNDENVSILNTLWTLDFEH